MRVLVLFLLVSVGAPTRQILKTVKIPDLTLPRNEVVLRGGDNVRSLPGHRPTFRYSFMDGYLWEGEQEGQRLRAFGVRTEGEAALTLHDSSGRMADLVFLVGGGTCSVRYLHGDVPSVRRRDCGVELRKGAATWFTVASSPRGVALHADNEILVGISRGDLGLDVDFNRYDKFSLSSREEAIWDVQGHTLSQQPLPRFKTNLRLLRGLSRVARSYDNIGRFLSACDSELKRTLSGEEANEFYYEYCQNDTDLLQEAFTRLETILLINGLQI